jgi:hypothetical protein
MTPAHELLLAHLRKGHEALVTLRRQRDDLQSNLRNMRISRDLWKEKALMYRYRCKLIDSRLRSMRQSRDMWKHRALIASWSEVSGRERTRPVRTATTAGTARQSRYVERR